MLLINSVLGYLIVGALIALRYTHIEKKPEWLVIFFVITLWGPFAIIAFAQFILGKMYE